MRTPVDSGSDAVTRPRPVREEMYPALTAKEAGCLVNT